MNALTRFLTATLFSGNIFAGSILLATTEQAHAEESRCDEWAAILESLEGEVLWQAAGSSDWQTAQINETFCYGDQLRVTKLRAALRLANDTLVRLNEKSTIKLLPEKKSFWVELVEGAGHFLSRTPKDFTVKAPYLNAAVDGTEFLVGVHKGNDVVAVFEGEVKVSDGSQSISLTNGQKTQSIQNLGVTSVSLRDAAQWALYSPPLIIQAATSADIQNLLNKGDLASAYSALNEQPNNDGQLTALKASLALALGDTEGYQQTQQQLDPTRAESLAFQSLHDLFVKGDTASALEKSQQALAKDANNTSALLAHTYSLQANTKIEEAYSSAEQALSLGANNAYALARTAELALSIGKTDRAEALISKAQSQYPEFSRIYSLAGFTALNKFKSRQAEQKFKRAIELDSSDGLAHFGLALSLINQGHIDKGQKKMELAVLLDPGNSLYRSYLGKTYFEQQQFSWAETQYLLAKQLDPNDPTPYFYEAHLAKEQNELPKALELINEAIEKNHNRAVYRSRMLLDSDVAARSANQAQIYQALGFDEHAKDTAALAITDNPFEFAPYQSFVNGGARESTSQYSIASNAKLSRLLQPVSAEPLAPGVGEIGLLTQPWLTPEKLGAQEYTSLYSQKGLSGQTSLRLGSQQTKGYEVNLYAHLDTALVSGGKYKIESLGSSVNNDANIEIDEISLHKQIGRSKVLLRGTKRNESYGDLINNTNSEYFNQNSREINIYKTYEAGITHHFASTFFAILSYDKTYSDETTLDLIEPFPGVSIPIELKSNSTQEKAQIQLIKKFDFATTTLGYTKEEFSLDFKNPITEEYEPSDETEFDSTYLSLITKPLANTRINALIQNVDVNNKFSPGDGSGNSLNYNLGMHIDVAPMINVTLATWMNTAQRLPRTGNLLNGLIFNIDTNTDSGNFNKTKGKAIKIAAPTKTTHTSLEAKHLDHTRSLTADTGATIRRQTDEKIVKFKNETLATENIVLYTGIEFYEGEKSDNRSVTEPDKPQSVIQKQANIGMKYFFKENLTITLEFTAISQELLYLDESTTQNQVVEFNTNTPSADIADLEIEYSINKEKWISSLGIKNITNSKHSLYQSTIRNANESFAPTVINWPNERVIFASIKVGF